MRNESELRNMQKRKLMCEDLCGMRCTAICVSRIDFAESQIRTHVWFTNIIGIFSFTSLIRIALLRSTFMHVSTFAACVTCILRAFKVLQANTYTYQASALYLHKKFQFAIIFQFAWFNLLTFSVALTGHSKQRRKEVQHEIYSHSKEMVNCFCK